MALMTAATDKGTRGGAMGVCSTMRIVGFATGPLIGGFLHVRYGFNAAFLTGTAFVLLGLVLVRFWVHDPPVAALPAETKAPRGGFFNRDILSGGIVSLGAATFIMAAVFTMMSTLEVQFNERLDQAAFAFSVAFWALMVSRLVAQIPLGRLSDRIGRKPLIVGGLLLMAPATACLGIAVGPLIAALALFELPFLVGGAIPVIAAWIVWRFVPETVRMRRAA